MLVADLINYDIPFLRLSDSVGRAIDIMHDAHQNQLPVIEENRFLYLLSDEHLSNYDEELDIFNLPPMEDVPLLHERLHLLQLPVLFQQKNSEMLPVADGEGFFKGMVLQKDVNKEIVDSIFSLPVGLVSVLLNNKDYSLSNISRIAETENVKIMKVFVSGSGSDTENDLQVLLQFNSNEISGAINSLRRFGYNAENLTPGQEIESIDRDRYELLMKYLEI